MSCSEPHYSRFRQDVVREQIAEVAEAHDNGWELFRRGALEQLKDDDAKMIVRALTCLFVVGDASNVPVVEPLLSHELESVRKAARTCLFEIRTRTGDQGAGS